MSLENWPNWLRWAVALPSALLAGFAVRLFFAFLEWSTSDRTSFFEGGIAYLLTSSEIGRYVLSFIIEGIACFFMFAAFMHTIPSHYETARTAFVSVALTLSLVVIGLSLLAGTGKSEDIVGIMGGIFGYLIYYFRGDDW